MKNQIFNFLRSLFVHMRPYLLFISGVSGLSGMALSNDPLSLKKFVILFICYFCIYGFGQALTDCFQLDTDKISSPYRPLSQGLISKKALFASSLTGLLLIAIALIYYNNSIIVPAIAAILGLISYTHFKKNYWMGGPICNSLIVCLLPLMGLLSAESNLNLSILSKNPELIYILCFNFFAYSNFVLIGYLKDISADKATNYNTFPVKFGWNATVLLGDSILLMGIVLLWINISTSDLAIITFFIVAIVIGLYGQIKAHFPKKKEEEYSRIPIESTVRFFITGNIAIILSLKPSWLIFLVIFYICFELTLLARPERSQI